jgi:hypothetical protein
LADAWTITIKEQQVLLIDNKKRLLGIAHIQPIEEIINLLPWQGHKALPFYPLELQVTPIAD